MSLPKLKEVAAQLGIDGATKLKKDALVTAIADLQAANRDAANVKPAAKRAMPKRIQIAKIQITLLIIQMTLEITLEMTVMFKITDHAITTAGSVDVVTATVAEIAIVAEIATAIVDLAKSASQ